MRTRIRTAEPIPVRRAGTRAMLLAVLCAAGCLAVPLTAGGIAAVSGATLAGWPVAVGVALATVAVGALVLRRRDGSAC